MSQTDKKGEMKILLRCKHVVAYNVRIQGNPDSVSDVTLSTHASFVELPHGSRVFLDLKIASTALSQAAASGREKKSTSPTNLPKKSA